MNLTYAGTGVNYDAMDPFKRECQKRAVLTSKNAERFGLISLEWTRGESVHAMHQQSSSATTHHFFGHVEEGLGTKNMVADAMYELTGRSFYDQIAQDTVAMIVNDMVTLGLFPTTLAMHLAVGNSDWFNDAKRAQDLIDGWGDACDEARCVWSGGETPTLSGLPYPVLAGSAAGISKRKKLINPASIRAGDQIIFLESSGIHANGLTLARKIAEKLPEGYMTQFLNGRTYGETLLDPTHIYVGFVEDCLNAGVDIHYAVNITGHGWRKLMRATQPFTYVVDRLPSQHLIFDFIQSEGPVEEKEMYGNYNMGAGFALYVKPEDVTRVCELGRDYKYGFDLLHAGHIEAGDKKVVIPAVGIEFASETLSVR